MSDEPVGEPADEPAEGAADGAVIRRIRQTDTLADLAALLDAPSRHAAYFRAKEIWSRASDDQLRPGRTVGGFPGDRIALDGVEITVHGVTHADSEAEREFVREHVTDALASGAAVYCEQGIRTMYLADMEDVCEMDDYRWAMAACERRDGEGCNGEGRDGGGAGHRTDLPTTDLEKVVADLSEMAPQLREATFTLIESGRELYGDEFASALGDVASSFLTSHEDLATGRDFEAFRHTRAAARDPAHLAGLQRYYWHAFLPQPLEREWLRRHDPKLELVTHARNERMADYVVHEADADRVHVLVGAAHQPGVIYYLRQYRDGETVPGDFEYVG